MFIIRKKNSDGENNNFMQNKCNKQMKYRNVRTTEIQKCQYWIVVLWK